MTNKSRDKQKQIEGNIVNKSKERSIKANKGRKNQTYNQNNTNKEIEFDTKTKIQK